MIMTRILPITRLLTHWSFGVHICDMLARCSLPAGRITLGYPSIRRKDRAWEGLIADTTAQVHPSKAGTCALQHTL